MKLEQIISRKEFDAVLFDLDGVLTPTAQVHSACWKEMFDEFLSYWSQKNNAPLQLFDITSDYLNYVDGRPRYEGVHTFLASRNIKLPYGKTSDAPGMETVCALGNQKEILVTRMLNEQGVEPYPSSVIVVEKLLLADFKTAVVSSSKNCQAVLQAARIEDLFDVRVDGKVAAQRGLPGKPAPDMFLEAAQELDVPVKRAIVVEDAISGVQAGAAGGFGLVIGIARHGDAENLKRHGADIVLSDLEELL